MALRVLLSVKNSSWGVQKNGIGEQFYEHVIDFADPEQRWEFLADEMFDGVDPRTLIVNQPETAFNFMDSNKAVFRVDVKNYVGENYETLLNKDFMIILDDAINKYTFWAVEGKVKGNRNIVEYDCVRDFAFELGYNNLFRDDRQVIMERAHVDNVLADETKTIFTANIGIDSDNFYSENFDGEMENLLMPTKTFDLDINYKDDLLPHNKAALSNDVNSRDLDDMLTGNILATGYWEGRVWDTSIINDKIYLLTYVENENRWIIYENENVILSLSPVDGLDQVLTTTQFITVNKLKSKIGYIRNDYKTAIFDIINKTDKVFPDLTSAENADITVSTQDNIDPYYFVSVGRQSIQIYDYQMNKITFYTSQTLWGAFTNPTFYGEYLVFTPDENGKDVYLYMKNGTEHYFSQISWPNQLTTTWQSGGWWASDTVSFCVKDEDNNYNYYLNNELKATNTIQPTTTFTVLSNKILVYFIWDTQFKVYQDFEYNGYQQISGIVEVNG